MESYSTYWRTTIFAAIVFHFLAAFGFSYVLPHLMPEVKIEPPKEVVVVPANPKQQLGQPRPSRLRKFIRRKATGSVTKVKFQSRRQSAKMAKFVR